MPHLSIRAICSTVYNESLDTNCHRRKEQHGKKENSRKAASGKRSEPVLEKVQIHTPSGTDCGEALALALAMPQQDVPARRFHTNLLCFLQDFTVPKEANPEERSLYLELIRRFEAGGEVKPGVRRQFEQALEAAH
jgi:hypothetical protein